MLDHRSVAFPMMDVLRRPAYGGYDSAGVATFEDHRLKVKNLEARLYPERLQGVIGIGHMRWATHGRPNEANVHPHVASSVAVVMGTGVEQPRDLAKSVTVK